MVLLISAFNVEAKPVQPPLINDETVLQDEFLSDALLPKHCGHDRDGWHRRCPGEKALIDGVCGFCSSTEKYCKGKCVSVGFHVCFNQHTFTRVFPCDEEHCETIDGIQTGKCETDSDPVAIMEKQKNSTTSPTILPTITTTNHVNSSTKTNPGIRNNITTQISCTNDSFSKHETGNAVEHNNSESILNNKENIIVISIITIVLVLIVLLLVFFLILKYKRQMNSNNRTNTHNNDRQNQNKRYDHLPLKDKRVIYFSPFSN
uniref:uncharacterized protein LOC108950745 n=1 Tax=Ciona intestinalis TaxID=7719 RepID=UPI000EF46F5C|nr:uncharacterized protein LOC108950745 [Ciona intestinalis]|eukprot:XP_026695509.1 uncharacterized protein LOC108950745 [Ciona intestinalis]